MRYVIRLSLIPDDEPDQRVTGLVKKIPDLTSDHKREELFQGLNDLASATQEMLKAEWERLRVNSKTATSEQSLPFNKAVNRTPEVCHLWFPSLALRRRLP